MDQFAAAFEFAPIGIALLDMNSIALRVNLAMCQMLGYKQVDMVGISAPEVGHPDDLAEDADLRSQMLAGAFPSYQRDKRYLHHDGHVVWTHISCSLVHDVQGQPENFLLQVQDITQRKAAETALRESEERFRATFEHAALGMVHIALDGRMLRVNSSLCRMHGYSREELIGVRARDLMVVENWQQGDQDIQSLLDGRVSAYTAERRFVRKSGEIYPARVSVTLLRGDGAEPYFISIVEDLTQQVRDQQRIREQAQMLDQASDAIVVQDLKRRVLYWNQGAQRLFGWSPAQAEGRTIGELLGDSAALNASETALFHEHGTWVGERRCRASDGRLLEVERRLTLIRNDAGRAPAVLSVNTDVTERRRAERDLKDLNGVLEQRIRQRTSQLEQSNEELRTFAYSMAHDLRSPLATTDGFSRQLEHLLGDKLDDKARHYLNRVRHGVQQMSDLTDALLLLANLAHEPLQSADVDLSAIARTWLQRVQREDSARAAQVRIIDTPLMHGDPRLLKLLVENLLDNAWKFTSRRADAQIEFGATASGSGAPVFYVRDNGVGFDSAYADKLFTPFQRLHAAHEFAGTGIGLAMVRKIASRHGGRVWGESKPGAGAIFRFTLEGH